MRPGAIELTVTPSGPISRASVFAQPITPGRTAFESARLSIGSRTELDVMLITRPWPLRAEVGEAEVRQPTAESSRSSTAFSTSSSVRLDGRRARRAAAVVDEDVDPAERLERRLDESLQVLRVRQVAADGQARRAARPRARAGRAGGRTSRRWRPRRRAPRRSRARSRRRRRRRSPSGREDLGPSGQDREREHGEEQRPREAARAAGPPVRGRPAPPPAGRASAP